MADTPRPNVNPTPRARFQSVNGNITAHRSMLELPAFDRACDAALLEYQKNLASQSLDGNSAMACGFRSMGAVEFLNILKTIAEPAPVIAPRKDHDNLPDMTNLKRQ